jgi:hypothetical protein
MAEMLVQSESLTSIADKIRVLKGITEPLSLDDMETELDVIPKNDSTDLTASGATVTVPSGYYATQATKSVATATQATPSVSIDSAGKITASATQTAGYVSAGTKTGTKQLTTQAAKTVTPNTSSQTAVASGVYTTGAVTVAAIPSKYVDNSTVTAVESDVMSGKKYGANGSVKTGTFSLDSELSTQDNLIAQIQTALEGKAAGGSGGDINTCTVTLSLIDNTLWGSLLEYIVMRYINGEFVVTPGTCDVNTLVSYNDVVCGSIIYACDVTGLAYTAIMSDNLTPIQLDSQYDSMAWAIAPKNSNEICTIELRT